MLKSICCLTAACCAGAYSTAQTAVPQERYALLVGVEYRGNPNTGLSLDGPARDVDLVKRALGSQFQVRVLSDAQGSYAKPTTANIEYQLDDLKNWVTPGALLLVMFSGHGFMYHNSSYFLGSDANTSDITMRRRSAASIEFVKNRINQTRAGESVVLWDACRDGDAPGMSETDEVAGDEKPVTFKGGHLLLYSTAPKAESRTNPKTGIGFLTEAFVRSLSSSGQTWGDFANGLHFDNQQQPEIELSAAVKELTLPATLRTSTPATPSVCSRNDIIEDPCRCDSALTDPLKASGTKQTRCQTIGPTDSGIMKASQDVPFQLDVSTADSFYKQTGWFLRSDNDGTQTNPMQLPNGFEIAATGTGSWHVDRVTLDRDMLTVTASCTGVPKWRGHSPCSVTYEIIEHQVPLPQ